MRTMNEQFAEELLELVSETPVLVSDIIASLRWTWTGGVSRIEGGEWRSLRSKHRWANVRQQDVIEILQEFGAHVAYRNHASGTAIYAATVPFTEVPNPRTYQKNPAKLTVKPY